VCLENPSRRLIKSRGYQSQEPKEEEQDAAQIENGEAVIVPSLQQQRK
jgi:hypothetical protein